jgi:hypothetical protein
MKIVTASNGKKILKISKKEWEAIGKKADWDTNGFDEKAKTSEPSAITSKIKTSNDKKSVKKKKEPRKLHPDTVEFLIKVQNGKATEEDHAEYNKKHPEGFAFID